MLEPSKKFAFALSNPTYGFLRQLMGGDLEHPVTTAYCLPGTPNAVPNIKSASPPAFAENSQEQSDGVGNQGCTEAADVFVTGQRVLRDGRTPA